MGLTDPLNDGNHEHDQHTAFIISSITTMKSPTRIRTIRPLQHLRRHRPAAAECRHPAGGGAAAQPASRKLIIAELALGQPPIHRSLNAYGLSGKTVQIMLPQDGPAWLGENEEDFAVVRGTRVFAGSERLELAEAPIGENVGGCEIELDGLYDGLQPGRGPSSRANAASK